MEPKRYWWVSYGTGKWVRSACIDEHPFLWISRYTGPNGIVPDATIINYHLVDVTEYNLWQELNNNSNQ